jgi:MFS family permease
LATGELDEERPDAHSLTRRAGAVFWQYWTASTISSTGDAVTAVALPLTAIELLRASSFEVSWLTAATYSAWFLIGLPAGVIVQRLPMRGTQVAMDLIRAAALASIPLAAWAGALTVGQLVLAALIVGFATVIFDVGNSTLLPFIVSKDELTVRNSLMDASVAVTQTGGPSLGGLLVQLLAAPGALVADVVSYVASAALLSRLPRPGAARPAPDRTAFVTQIRDGCAYVLRHPVIGPCTLCAAVGNFVVGGLIALTPVFLVRTLHAPPWLVGVLIATDGAGSLLGAALTSRLAGRLGTGRATVLAETAAVIFALLMPAARSGWGVALFAIGNAGFAAGVVVGNVLTRTYRQTAVPPALFPRVMATVRFLSWGVIPFGALVTGAVASAAGNRAALWFICLVNVAAPLSLLMSRVRRCRDLSDGSP